jgi:hypothetical protein
MEPSPIFIVGAPRSGTSLLQKLLRECPGHASVPREAQHIWGPHVHPSLSGWSGEVAPESVLDDAALIASIRDAFSQSAVPAATWRRMESGALGGNKWLRRIARLFPRQAVEALIRSGRTSDDVRLVEKSVHAGLWLPLVDAVFPDARYLHIVRDPGKSIPSIMTGWLEPVRFAAFQVPEPLQIEGLGGATSDWCFPLPIGWRDYRKGSLQSVATFQWTAINTAILDFFGNAKRRERCLQVRLEDLVARPGDSLRSIRRHANIVDRAYFDAFEAGLPVINRGRKHAVSVAIDEERLRADTAAMAAELGYTPD